VDGDAGRAAHVEVVRVETRRKCASVMSRAGRHDIYIGAAAVADYTPAEVQPEKSKNSRTRPPSRCKNTDILALSRNWSSARLPWLCRRNHDLENYALSN